MVLGCLKALACKLPAQMSFFHALYPWLFRVDFNGVALLRKWLVK